MLIYFLYASYTLLRVFSYEPTKSCCRIDNVNGSHCCQIDNHVDGQLASPTCFCRHTFKHISHQEEFDATGAHNTNHMKRAGSPSSKQRNGKSVPNMTTDIMFVKSSAQGLYTSLGCLVDMQLQGNGIETPVWQASRQGRKQALNNRSIKKCK